MPPLSAMLTPKGTTLAGYQSAEKDQIPPPMEPPGKLGANKYIRSPLPPFSATTDTLRQFNEDGHTPTRRVIPLPNVPVGTGGTTINNTVVTNNGGGSGGSTQTKLTAQTAVVNVPVLAPGEIFQTTIQMAKSFQLLSLSSTNPVEVRIYGNGLVQAADVVRLTDTAVPFEVVSNILTDVVFDTSPFFWNWQNRIGANADDPQSLNIYVSVINPDPTTGQPATVVTITFLPLES